LLAARPTLGEARLLALDGRAGAGKSSLAHELTGEIVRLEKTLAVVRLDDLYDGWDGLNSALADRVVEQILEPLAAGRSARWQSYDWESGSFDGWHELLPPDVLLLEGCGAGDRRYAAYCTLLVWVEADPDARLARALARDGDTLRRHWAAWTRSEDRHFTLNDTRARADVEFVSADRPLA
jgi:uridine kinase